MKNPEQKETTVITPEVVSHQASSPSSGETYYKSRSAGIGGKAGLAIGSVAICGLGFVAGMQMNNMRHGGGAHGQAGGPPGMSRHQDGQHLGRAQAGGDQYQSDQNQNQNQQNRPNNGQTDERPDQNQDTNNQRQQMDRPQGQPSQRDGAGDQQGGGAPNSDQSKPGTNQQVPLRPNHGGEPRGKSQHGDKPQGQQPPQSGQGNGQRRPDNNAQPQPVNKQ